MVNGIDPCLLQIIAPISHDALVLFWYLSQRKPTFLTAPKRFGFSSGGRTTVSSQFGSFTLHRGNCRQNTEVKKNTWQPREKNAWGIEKNGNKFEKQPWFLRHQCQIWENHGNSQHIELPMNKKHFILRTMTHWFYFHPLNPLKMAPKTTENDRNLGTAVNTSKTHQTRVT